MRVVLGLLVLLTLFWMAASWQSRQTSRLRREREQVHGRIVRPPSRFAREALAGDGFSELAPPPGHSSALWSTLVVGRPSGAEPRPLPGSPEPDPVPAPEPAALPEPAGEHRPPPVEARAPVAFRYRIRRGDVLGTICADFYGAERGPFENLAQLTRAVARYNALERPDDIRPGQELLLPPLGELAP